MREVQEVLLNIKSELKELRKDIKTLTQGK